MATGSMFSRFLLPLLLAFILVQGSVLVEGKCCENKFVGGSGPKSGYYSLVMTSDTIPEFCIGGCVYTKKDDPEPGTMYCFQAGDMDTTCKGGPSSGGGCGEVMGWIEKYFKQECGNQVNKVLDVEVFESEECSSGWCSRVPLLNATVILFDSENCAGKPFMEMKTGEPERDSCWYGSQAFFFVSVQKAVKWSMWAGKEGYEPECSELGVITPFGQKSFISFTLDKPTIPIVSILLNFTWDATPELLPDVMVQTNPYTCVNISSDLSGYYGPGYGNIGCSSGGSGYGSGWFRNGGNENNKESGKTGSKMKKDKVNNHGNIRQKRSPAAPGKPDILSETNLYNDMQCSCAPTCEFVSWVTDVNTGCDCRGVAAGGLNFTEITYPDSTPPFGLAKMKGSIYWYNTESEYLNYKFSLVYSKFTRRSVDDEVCASNLSLTLMDLSTGNQISRNVPCFSPQIPPTTMPPTYPPYPTTQSAEFPTGSTPDGTTDGATHGARNKRAADGATDGTTYGTTEGTTYGPDMGYSTPGYGEFTYPPVDGTLDKFTEVDNVLIYGGGDMYWLVGCMGMDYLGFYIDFPDFFTSKNPADTPSFCGCLFSISLGPFVPTTEQLKWCYMEALYMGKSVSLNRSMGKTKEEKSHENEQNTHRRQPIDQKEDREYDYERYRQYEGREEERMQKQERPGRSQYGY